MPSDDVARVLAAIPGDHERARTTASWCRLVETHPAITALREDARANALGVLWVLARHTDHRTRITRPSWIRIQDITGLSRSTVAKWLRWARLHNLIGHVEQGSTDRYRAGQDPSDVGNRAAVYVLLSPADTPKEISRTPSPVPDSVNKPSHARKGELSTRTTESTDHSTPWDDLERPRTGADRIAAALALQRGCPIARQVSPAHLRNLCRDFFDKGWCVRDVRHALDHSPAGEHKYAYRTQGIRFPAGWIAARLTFWRDEEGIPILSPRQERQRDADALREARTASRRTIIRTETTAPAPAHHPRIRHAPTLAKDREMRAEIRREIRDAEAKRLAEWQSVALDPTPEIVDSQRRALRLRAARIRAAADRLQRRTQ